VVSSKELGLIEKSVRKEPGQWVAQRMFASQPALSDEGEVRHVCVGVFTVDGKCAGFYGRVSPSPRIDETAEDAPVLVREEANHAR